MSAFGGSVGLLLVSVVLLAGFAPLGGTGAPRSAPPNELRSAVSNGSAVGNFSAVVARIVVLLGAAGGGLLAIVWARVALSWFSNDVTKKIQAKDRARDALVGTLLFSAALSGLIWGLARWVLTGS
ncbi:MAG: hypothetical protein L3K18_03915 [Thermoplasmata archaeon]|nr:hypothetical protein [Thermoplasmata archaeon]MCI4356276.1 hypothetical protein [Thermoplasmata archaeon]